VGVQDEFEGMETQREKIRTGAGSDAELEYVVLRKFREYLLLQETKFQLFFLAYQRDSY
jgi:hypothetical protein